MVRLTALGAIAVLLALASALLAWFLLEHPIRPGYDGSVASLPFLGLVGVGATACFVHLALTWSMVHALPLLAVSVIVSTGAEFAGVLWGLVFGASYAYHPQLQPRIGGVVPAAIPIAWFIVSCLPLVAIRPWLQAQRRSRIGWLPPGDKRQAGRSAAVDPLSLHTVRGRRAYRMKRRACDRALDC